jgi:predicted Fe-Mo cluster-binding NifX family protein
MARFLIIQKGPGAGPDFSRQRAKEISMVAIPVFRARVAPVLDWCSKILIVSDNGPETGAGRELYVQEANRFALMRSLHQQGITLVICGALSPEILNYGESLGLKIIHGIAGDVGEVLEAYRKGELDLPKYWLPGCRGQRRYKDGAQCGAKAAGSHTQGPKPARKESQAVLAPLRGAGGPGGLCVCPECAATLPHERGIPCSQLRCPRCSATMIRKSAP